MKTVTFLGCGSWGGALGKLLSEKGLGVTMWHRNLDVVNHLKDAKTHYLIPELIFPSDVEFTNDISSAIQSSKIIVLALPSQSIRDVITKNKSSFNKNHIIVNVSKGIEVDTLMTVSEVINDALDARHKSVVTLSGPSHAEEVINGHPTTLVAASNDIQSAEIIQNLFATEMLRTYLNRDIRGVELGGSMKNVIAIAAGICDGIGYGDNSKAALMTRGMMEITRLGEAMGAKVETFRGLSGYGDLIVTCLSKHSRNRQLGQLIGEGKALEDITVDMSMIAEGIFTAKSVHQLQLKHNVEMPIHEAIYQVLFQKKDPKNSVLELMTRKLSEELN
ncbi:MAG: NAD(P)H-dependent glycerol-3-phosphate dehydrogenase [Candidatus Neomarinimicrobiota bacterium]